MYFLYYALRVQGHNLPGRRREKWKRTQQQDGAGPRRQKEVEIKERKLLRMF